eukprot:Protomagalhaensia_wolfi_Nauph_80__1231@NODE_1727_length_1375_cov_54_592814_g1342_i0_p1_GENE_NODE_1727_length_1375_cov_54_592814_g1342_i0NODE_1727_length_1375_cov_54_592814_g1342_i0_p1_ORF_typecomplete_len194_score6_07_NODE_1727_length_1375_cov_54_592814_g1342_i065583
MADEDEAFSVIGERLIHDGGGLLVVPQQWTLLDLYVSVAVKYPRCLSSSINSGLVSTMLSLLEGYTEIPKPYNKIRIPAHRIMSFLYLLTKQCTKDQVSDVLSDNTSPIRSRSWTPWDPLILLEGLWNLLIRHMLIRLLTIFLHWLLTSPCASAGRKDGCISHSLVVKSVEN